MIGRELTLNRTAYTIIGVLPGDYRNTSEVIVPLSTDLYPRLFERDSTTMGFTGRLAPERTITQTEQALQSVVQGLARQYPDQIKLKPDALPRLRPMLGLMKFDWQEVHFHTMLGVVALLVLLIACANVAGLLLALGAGGSDVLRLMLRESLSLVIAGAVLGVAGSLVLTRVLQGFLAADISPLDPLAFVAMVATLLVTTMFAVYFPARRATRVDPMVTLRHE